LSVKQILIGLAIVGIFVVYSIGIRHESPVLAKPPSLATTNSGSATPTPASSGSTGGGTTDSSAAFKDGTYTGTVADAYYGSVQVSATISGGKLTSVQFLQYPDTHSTSIAINSQAMPYLQQEAIQAQSANVSVVSGATLTSQAFIQSLTAALSQAQA
jgi:uncharacterized protein with FMN-binding domain